jgi:ipoprotein LpqH
VRDRFVAATVAAAVLLAACSGCFMRPQKLPQRSARVTVDSTTRSSHAVSCTQVQWLLTAEISAAPARIKVVLKLDSEKPRAESVNIDNFQGFTGIADTGIGTAAVVFADDIYTVTGKAQGSMRNDSHLSTTAPFKIEVSC